MGPKEKAHPTGVRSKLFTFQVECNNKVNARLPFNILEMYVSSNPTTWMPLSLLSPTNSFVR